MFYIIHQHFIFIFPSLLR